MTPTTPSAAALEAVHRMLSREYPGQAVERGLQLAIATLLDAEVERALCWAAGELRSLDLRGIAVYGPLKPALRGLASWIERGPAPQDEVKP